MRRPSQSWRATGVIQLLNLELRKTSMNSAGVNSGSMSYFIVLFLWFNINQHPVVDQIAFQVTARGVDELDAVASFATEIIDSCFIVNMFGSLKLEG